MTESRRGAGVVFYDRKKRRALFFRRDNKPTIPFPDHLDILGGHIEEGETPEEAVVREMAEELDDLRSGGPYTLADYRLFTVHTDEPGAEDYVFCKEVDFALEEVRLKEGQELVWLTEEQAERSVFAFGYNRLIAEFFQALRNGRM